MYIIKQDTFRTFFNFQCEAEHIEKFFIHRNTYTYKYAISKLVIVNYLDHGNKIHDISLVKLHYLKITLRYFK